MIGNADGGGAGGGYAATVQVHKRLSEHLGGVWV